MESFGLFLFFFCMRKEKDLDGGGEMESERDKESQRGKHKAAGSLKREPPYSCVCVRAYWRRHTLCHLS